MFVFIYKQNLSNLTKVILLLYKKVMILRSGRRIGGDAVIIDFDYSSREWRKNKIAIGQGSFKYK